MLESFDDLDLLGDAGVMLEHFEQSFGAFVDVVGLFGKEVKKALFARQKALQKPRHVSDSPLRSPWIRQGECKRGTEERATGAPVRYR
jgi:hypothetical protein